MKGYFLPSSLSGILLQWTCLHVPALQRISTCIIKEISAYFDDRRMIFIDQATVFYYHLDSRMWNHYCLPILKQPRFVVPSDAVYLFTCGEERTHSYQLHFPAQLNRLPDSLMPHIKYTAVLYDHQKRDFYLFGGERNNEFLKSIQVYNSQFKTWKVLKEELKRGRFFAAGLKYKRIAYLLCGEPSYIMMFRLDTRDNWLLPVPVLTQCFYIY